MLAVAGREADIVNLQGVSTVGSVIREALAGRSAEAPAAHRAGAHDGWGERGVAEPELSILTPPADCTAPPR